MATFKNNTISLETIEYSNTNNILNNLEKYGFGILPEVIRYNISIPDSPLDSTEKIFLRDDSEFINFKNYIFHTNEFESFKKLGELDLIDYRYRSKKNKSYTNLHTDKYSLAHCMLRSNFLIFWSPINDISIDDGSLFFCIVKENTKFKQEELNVLFENKKHIYSSPYNGDISIIFENYKKFEQGLGERNYNNIDKDYICTFYSKSLKKGDLVVFKKNTIHGALDCNCGVRKSIDFRVSIDLKKDDEITKKMKNLDKTKIVDNNSSTRNVFDYSIFSMM
jgi:hypothetical protein